MQPHVKHGTLKKPTELIQFEWDKEKSLNIKELVKQGVFDMFPKTI